MADDTDTAEGAPAAAHGPAIAGKGKGKGKGLLNGPHREEIIVVCSVIGVGLAFLTLRKGASSAAGTSTPSAALSTSGTSASLGTGTGQLAGGYSDANAGLQQYLAQISDQLGGMEASLNPTAGQGVTPATPSPIAAGLLAPSSSTDFARTDNGSIYQIEQDGTALGLTYQQWLPFSQAGASYQSVGAALPAGAQTYTTAGNLRAKIGSAGAAPAA